MATADTPDEEQAAPETEPVAWVVRALKSVTIFRSRLLLSASGRSARAVFWLRQHMFPAEIIVWLILIGIGAKLGSEYRLEIAGWFAAPRLNGLQTLLVGTGTALIGGTAIAASLVLFAMQVNVERLPFGLFRRLSSDVKLLLAFAGSFALAIAVASFSLITSPANAAFFVGATVLFILLILRSFLYAYRRSLALISPEYQLELIRADAAKEARRWNRRARWAEQLLEKEEGGKFDQLRYTISQVDPRLSIATERGLKHSVALARKLSDQGDAIAAETALQTVVVINQIYVAARGRSFVASTLIGDNEHVHDSIVTQSIETIKHYYRSALARRDEEQMISSLDTLRALASAYLRIEYRDECCRDHERDELRKHALWLVSVFSWLSTEPEPALHVHNLSFIEYLLRIARTAREWGGDDVLEEVRKRLLKWSIAVSLHQWDALENGIYALAVIAVAQGEGEPDRLLRDLQANVNEAWVSKETRDHVARELRLKADNPLVQSPVEQPGTALLDQS